jgi:hypothetical protein
MKLKADAGTAKLSGSACTSAMKAKKENARQTMDRIR